MPDRRRAVCPVLRHGRRLSERTLRHASLVEPESSETIHYHKESPHTERRVTAQAEGHGPESSGRGRLGIFQSDNGRRRKTEQTVQAGPAVRRSDFFSYMDEKPIYECHVGRIHVRNHRQHALFRPGKTLLLLLESANRRIQTPRQRLEKYPDLYENYLAEPEPGRKKTLEDYFIEYLIREKPELLKSVPRKAGSGYNSRNHANDRTGAETKTKRTTTGSGQRMKTK